MQCAQDLNMFKRSTVIISIIFGSGSRAPTTSKMDLFWVIVNGCVNGLKHSIFLKTGLLHTAVNYFHKELHLR